MPLENGKRLFFETQINTDTLHRRAGTCAVNAVIRTPSPYRTESSARFHIVGCLTNLLLGIESLEC
jgi:hypothetical protein